jgi:hypothetical protein
VEKVEESKMTLMLQDASRSTLDEVKRFGKKLRRPFLTPCRRTKGIKQALAEHIQGRRPMICRYIMREAAAGMSRRSRS